VFVVIVMGQLDFDFIPGTLNVVDVLTKPLVKGDHDRFAKQMGMVRVQ
jgi:hypothetical protein